MSGNSPDTVTQSLNPGYTYCPARVLFIRNAYPGSIDRKNKGRSNGKTFTHSVLYLNM